MLKSFLFSSLLLISSTAIASKESHRATLKTLLNQSKDKFRIDSCQKFKLNPSEIFNSIKYKTTFSKGCDLQGEVSLKLFMPFDLNMEVQNLAHYKKIMGTAKLNLGMETPPKILGEITKGELQGKDSIYFNAYYSGEVLPASTLKVRPGSEKMRIEIFEKGFTKKLDEFSIDLK